jgi:branched-chain amino acid transport system substrate-binding protein
MAELTSKHGDGRWRSETRWTVLAGALALVAALLLAGCGGGEEPAREIKLGLVTPLSGELAASGTSASRAVRLKIKAVNQAGGLLLGGTRYRLGLEIEDGGDNPQTAVAAAQKLINQKGIAALIGALPSRGAIPVARVAEKARVPMICPSSTHPETTAGKRFVFRACITDPFQGRVLARFAFNDLGTIRAAVLFDAASAYNQTLAKVFRAEYSALGGRITGFEFYTTGETDFRDQLRRIALTEPHLLFLPNYYYDAVRQVEQAREIGLECLVLGSDGWDGMPGEGYAAIQEAFHSTLWVPDPEDDRNRTFINAYRKAYHGEPDTVAALAYDSVGLLVEALGKSDRADSEGIREGLAAIRDYRGLAGTISFEKGGDPIKSVSIVAVREGRPVFFKVFNPD